MPGNAKSMPLPLESANTRDAASGTCSGKPGGKLFADIPNNSCLGERRRAAPPTSRQSQTNSTLVGGTIDAPDRYAAHNEDLVPVARRESGPYSGPRRAERAKRHWFPGGPGV